MFPISRFFSRISRRSGASDGFVLIELVVAMIAALMVCAAVILMLQVSMGQAARASNNASATHRGRTALETILTELHDSCVAPRVPPVGAGSDANRLLVVSGSGESGSADTVALHEITLANGVLTDTSYPTTGTKPAPEWEFAKTGTTTTLATGIAPVGTTPVFQYFAYGPNSELQSTPLPTPLSDASASEASAVTVTFTAVPQATGSGAGSAFVLADTALLRLSSSVSGESGPCA